MPAGLGGAGYVAVVPEVTMGTYLDPSTAGAVFVPILDESLVYNEDKYYSPQIRQQVMVSEQKQSYYSVGGDITMEVDPNYLPYFLHASRHTITRTGAGAPYVYKYVPAVAGQATTGAGSTTRKTLSITVVRNGIGFGYAGCCVGSYEFTIEDGVLRVTFGIVGLSEATPSALGTPTWLAPKLYGADASSVFVDAAGTAPAFATASLDFNGFTFSADHNAEAQNRIRSDRAASYVSFGETESTYDSELDFVSKTEYDAYKASTKRATRLLSRNPGTANTLALANDGVQISINNTSYDSYEVALPGMGDLIMASITGRALGIAGGDAYAIEVKSDANIA